ncbi:DUF1206 domain-containing protein [Streptomyces triticisoli]|uniref:DUF1206 domain-containing protein n=1 Tax=Streptomyces triticisoli TaxID=2182797 RepID=UPI003F6A4BDC
MRTGPTARGVIDLLVGVPALRSAFGDGTRQADLSGAPATLGGEPFGARLPALVAAGFLLFGPFSFAPACRPRV